MNRPDFERGTLGEEIYLQLERDLPRTANDPVAKTAVFQASRDGFVWAIDTTMPEPEIDPFEVLTLDLLPYWDDNSIPDLVRKLDHRAHPSSSDATVVVWDLITR